MSEVSIHQMSEADYQRDPCKVPSLSASIAKILIGQTPLHAWTAHPRLNPNFVREDKEIFERGTVAHALLLQGIEVAVVLDLDDWKTKAARETRDGLRAIGQIPILKKHWESTKRMVERAREQLAAHKEARDAFTNGKPEQVITWTDDHGVICRARMDWLHDDYHTIDDYKSSGRDVNPETIASRIVDDWDIQEAFYRRGIKKLTAQDPRFRFIAQENTEPFALSVIGFGPDIQWMGDSKVQRAIDLWAKCLEKDKWPGYPDRICFPMLPKWAEEAEVRRQQDGVSI